jgi:adsorption protein B
LYLLTGWDDLIWDLVTLFKRTQYRKQVIDLHKLDATAPKLLAVVIAAWHEDNVLSDVIENFIASAHYPRSMSHIFLRVYPYDDATHAVASSLAKKYANVHVVVNALPGRLQRPRISITSFRRSRCLNAAAAGVSLRSPSTIPKTSCIRMN